MKYKFYLILILLLSFRPAIAQSPLSSDELFQQARTAAFDQKNYPKAISLCKEALGKSPDYSDIRIFMGRLYTWSKQPDSARTEFTHVLIAHPDHEDGAIAATTLEYWYDNSEKALEYAENGLKYHPESADLLLMKAKILNDLRRFKEANTVTDILLKTDPNNTDARVLANRIRENVSKNKVGISYDYIYFDKQFDDPWHLASFDYGIQTRLGSITARVNYANRFRSNGTQFELDAYPHISNTFYAYLSGGYSTDVGVFPEYRAGFSLYANLPAGFEAEGGFRFLRFSDNTWIYTGSIGKYLSSYWFNFRTFLTPSNNALSQSYSLNIRYYYGGADDYLNIGAGTGISPDDQSNDVLLDPGNTYKLQSSKVTAGYHHSFKTFNVFYINGTLYNQEYRLNTRGNQLSLGIGYLRRF